MDGDLNGIQKMHKTPVPRIGGIALMVGILMVLVFEALGYTQIMKQGHTEGLLKLLLAGMPAFTAGLVEDFTKRVSVKARLLATFASALLASWLLGAYLPRVDIWGLDELLQLLPIALIVTAFAVAGVANSINIIDGFNGLAATVVIILLAGMGFLSWEAGDIFVAELALVGIGATLGFLVVNYPTGRLFLGDGGAYLAGFWVAEVAVLLIVRNPGINAWQVLAICAYPVIEVVYSIYRRKVIRKADPSSPDRLHLHSLIYRRLVCQVVPRNDDQAWIRNAAVACSVGMLVGMMTSIAVGLGDTLPRAIGVVAIEVMLYLAIYKRLVRGRWHLNPLVVFGLRPAAGMK
jgi:UDP-N-acetylmuramyl pentapeptide phosphotransferase/UDP-N-acetylglucosamine-1-phosphate transferase